MTQCYEHTCPARQQPALPQCGYTTTNSCSWRPHQHNQHSARLINHPRYTPSHPFRNLTLRHDAKHPDCPPATLLQLQQVLHSSQTLWLLSSQRGREDKRFCLLSMNMQAECLLIRRAWLYQHFIAPHPTCIQQTTPHIPPTQPAHQTCPAVEAQSSHQTMSKPHC